jgi:hypothetical protein
MTKSDTRRLFSRNQEDPRVLLSSQTSGKILVRPWGLLRRTWNVVSQAVEGFAAIGGAVAAIALGVAFLRWLFG